MYFLTDSLFSWKKSSFKKKAFLCSKIIVEKFGDFKRTAYFCSRKHQELPSCGTPTEFRIEITTVVKGCVSNF